MENVINQLYCMLYERNIRPMKMPVGRKIEQFSGKWPKVRTIFEQSETYILYTFKGHVSRLDIDFSLIILV